MSTLCFYAQFTANNAGLDSLTPTWDIERITRSNGTRSALVTGGANSIAIGRRGLYGYILTNADVTLYDYIGTAITADATVDQKEVPAMWTLWAISWHDIATSALTLAGSIGKLFTDYLDAAISTRTKPADTQAAVTSLTNAPADSSGVTTLLTRLSDTRAGYLDTLNGIVATIWSNIDRTLTSFGFTVPITPPADMALNSTVAKDATVSKPGIAQTISSNADITSILSGITSIMLDYARRTGDYATINALWDEILSSHVIPGSAAYFLKNAGDGSVTVNASVAISEAVAKIINTGSLAIQTHNTMSQSITSTFSSDLHSATKLWLSIKKSPRDLDSNSIIFVEKTDGLTVVNKLPYTNTTDGTLVVTGTSGAWIIAIKLEEVATSLLEGKSGSYPAELKVLIGGDTLILWSGYCEIIEGLVKAIS